MKKIYQGYRFFKCDCGTEWIESCRDHSTDSVSICPIQKGSDECLYGSAPYKSIPDENIKIDKFGNLLEPEEVWIKQ